MSHPNPFLQITSEFRERVKIEVKKIHNADEISWCGIKSHPFCKPKFLHEKENVGVNAI